MALHIDIEALLSNQRIESNRIEFKQGWNASKIYQSICAFANDFDNIGGGYILVGVEEENGIIKRPICGVPDESLDSIQKSMVGYNHKISPFYLPRTSIEEVDGKKLLVIWVPAGDMRPYEVRSSVVSDKSPSTTYIRSGSSTIEAKGEVLNELREMSNRLPFDERSNKDIALKDISLLLVQDYLQRVGSKLVDVVLKQDLSVTLEQLDLWSGPSENRRLKNVAAMMFCEDPRKYFPYTQVDIVMFPEGVIQNPNNMIEVPSITGSVPTMIRATLDYLRTNIIKERIIKPKGQAESIRFFNYPYQALEEAVVNALYHRDYQEYEAVEISVQPHEISILSYSGPDRSISADALKSAQYLQARRYRNRRLGDFLKELKLSEGRATGIPTIQDELKRNGSPKAIIETDQERSFFLIRIPCHSDFVHRDWSEDINDTINDIVNDIVNDTVNDTVKQRLAKMLQLLIQNPSLSKKQLALELGVSVPTISRDLSLLIEYQMIVREGSDRKGKWVFLSKSVQT